MLADFPHTALGQDLTLVLRVTPSVDFDDCPEFSRFPNLHAFTPSCVCPELRPLPSTGITRLLQYYEPLRHPRAPGLSVTGVRLVALPTTPRGFPCCARLPCVHAVTTTPAQRLGMFFARLPSRISLPRMGDRVDLRNVLFEDCPVFTLHYGLHTRWVT